MLDDIDRRLLRHLMADPDMATTALAARANVSGAVAARRLVRLRDTGAIKGVRAVIDWAALGYQVEVSLRFTLDKTVSSAFDDFLAAARKVPEVLEIQTFLGRVDVRLSIIARDMAHYQHIYRTKILALPHIADIESLMDVARIKSAGQLPI
ncbi:Lrp/AsnC family transcriptional regulator [Oceaniglobus ichthyenteri]|uniref:Lrp/AsnC family transcriptional regulator n=1 Tax=Oceaniglobus ichthyenteri TaxID=2136177 RepID=UPI000D3330FF|nr:Lrp/AsnC family transcriptional regulator [Oceaniglobus ichthyenteri]